MKKIALLSLAFCIYLSSNAQANRLHCATTNVGGCWSVGILSGCTSHTYHVQVCCGTSHAHAGCFTHSWSTENRSIINGSDQSTVQAEATRFAQDNNLNIDDIKYFHLTTCEPFEEDGVFYTYKSGDYVIDRTEIGWTIKDLEKIIYVKP